ncbi:radical SAM protein [Streptomyces sp. NPDC055210]
MYVSDGPEIIIWDTTYACPLRCVHCYSESGRRPTRQLRQKEEVLRVTDTFIALKPRVVSLAGGEPLLIKGIFDVARKLTDAGISTCIYTSGWVFDTSMPDKLAEVFNQVTVSIDGATAETHDQIRGRAGSFERALEALRLLDQEAARRAEGGLRPLNFTVEYVVVRSNFDQVEEFARTISDRYPRLSSITFNAAAPSGLGSSVEFGKTELLHDDQMAKLVSEEFRARLQEVARKTTRVFTTDNLSLIMPPDPLAEGNDAQVMQVEPDGEVRWMPVYEGSVGNLLNEDPHVIWERAKARWADPFVMETLSPVHTVREWAEAVRQINDRFGSEADRTRIERRAKGPVPVKVRPSR